MIIVGIGNQAARAVEALAASCHREQGERNSGADSPLQPQTDASVALAEAGFALLSKQLMAQFSSLSILIPD